MFKIILGIILGFMICSFYPEVEPIVKYKFLEPGGARYTMVEKLKEISY